MSFFRRCRLSALSLVTLLSLGCHTEPPCPASPTPCLEESRIDIEVGPVGALSDPLVSYRLTIVSSPVSKPGQGGAGGGADGAITQRCLFSTPQNLLRCEDGVFQGSIGYRSEAKCETSDPEISPGGDVDAAGAPVGGIKITPPQTSCGTTVKPLTLTLRTPAAVSSLTLTLERGDQRFAPVKVSLLPTQVRPDGPKCGVSCSQSLAALPLGALTSTR